MKLLLILLLLAIIPLALTFQEIFDDTNDIPNGLIIPVFADGDDALLENSQIQDFLAQKYGKINVVNQQSYPIVDGYWSIDFQTLGDHDLVISTINETTLWGPSSDVTFVELYDGDVKLVPIIKNNKMIFENYTSDDIGYLKVKVNTPGIHNIQLEFGSDVAYADNNASPISVVEINSSTPGLTLSNTDLFGSSIANIGDLNGDGVDDIAVGAVEDDFTGGARTGDVHILFLNTDGSVKSTAEINNSTTNGPTLSNDDRFGSSIANIGDLNNDGVTDIAVGAEGDDNGGDARGAVHILFLDTDGSVKSTFEINSSTPGLTLSDFNSFGTSIANLGDFNGDGVTDIAVGADRDSGGGTGRGAVHILLLNTDGSVISTVKINDLTANGPVLGNFDRFGSSIANIGDLNGDGVTDIAVGAINDDNGGANRGIVHVLFLNTDGSVIITVEIKSTTTNGPTLGNSDFFGTSITNIGDLNNDGVTDIAVGADNNTNNGRANRGAVHILLLNTDGSVISTVKINDLTANGPTLSDSDYFGSSIANIGDLNGDGVDDIAVGADGDDNGGDKRGVVHILFLNTISTSGNALVDSTVEINDSTPGLTLADDDNFGSSIANIGDLNGDGVDDIAVGADGDDNGGTSRGAVHVLFLNTDGSVISTVEINDSTTNGPVLGNFDNFGSSIANIGDLNGDGVTDIAVGADRDSGGGGNEGAVHILLLNTTGTVISTVEINNSTTNGPVLDTFDNFGSSIANIGDFNGDGVTDIAVGADDNGGDNEGAVHILFLNTDGSVISTVEINDLTANGPVLDTFDNFGTSIVNLGDLNGDGVTDIAVGADGDDNGGSGRGAVHILFLNTTGTVISTVEINNSTTNGPVLGNFDNFGISITNLGDFNGDGVTDIAVGADGDDDGGSGRGAVHVLFLNTDGSVKSTAEINDSTTNGPVLGNSDFFGSSIVNLGDLNNDGVTDIAVGADRDSGGGTGRGAVHVIFLDKTTVVTSVSSFISDATYLVGDIIDILVTFSESVLVTGLPQLTLETGIADRAVDFTDGNNTSVLRFNYTVQPGDTAADLDYLSTSSLSLNGGTINAVTSPSDDTLVDLQIPGILSSLSFNKNIVINGDVPTFISSTFDEVTGILSITFSETINATPTTDIISTSLHIRETGASSGGITLSAAELTTTVDSNVVSFTLDETNRQAVIALTTPQLDIDAGAVQNLLPNSIESFSDNTITITNFEPTPEPTPEPTKSSSGGSGRTNVSPQEIAKKSSTSLSRVGDWVSSKDYFKIGLRDLISRGYVENVSTIPTQSPPDWFYSTGQAWSDGNISNQEYFDAVKYLIDHKILK